ncbi:unnamed protein product [Pylaiella littoralis]
MGSSNGTASASPTTSSERDCSTKKRFCQTSDVLSSSSTEALLLSGLEAGMLKLDSPGVGGCGGGGGSSSSNGSGKSNSGVGLYSSSGAYSDHSRMPLRARISEVLAFLAVFALIASSAMQIAMVWVSFWVRVEEIRTRSVSFHRRTVAFPLWGLWVAALLGYRRMIYKRIAPDMAKLFMHAEILALVVLGMTVTVNFASYVHTPGEPLFDIGFLVVPEQSLDSPWRPVSDTLTALLPGIALLRSLFMERKQRVVIITSWFRLVSIVYMLRCLTIGLTSLPGPAPHCRDKALYNPPTSWHEIATRMGVMVGDFSSCGDLLFSGHAAFTTLTMLVFVKSWRGHASYRMWKVLGVVYLLTMCTLAIAGRKHYTVDITLGILIASLTFFRFENGWRASLFFRASARRRQQGCPRCDAWVLSVCSPFFNSGKTEF